MPKLKVRGQKWLKGFHVFFAAAWLGAGICLVVSEAFVCTDRPGALYGIDLAAKFIDDFIIIPAAFGSLLTGLAYSLFTNWGWIKHRWVAVKWLINIGGIIFGTFWLGPWTNAQPPISARLDLAALADPVYRHAKTMDTWWGLAQVLTLALAVFLSVLKPWKAKK